MIRAQGPLAPLESAQLRWTESGEPRSTRYEDCYYSRADGLAECRHVFLEGSDLPQRLKNCGQHEFTIAELGFGTGMNFLLSSLEFLSHAPTGQRLHYWSVDLHPMSRGDLERSLQRWPQLGALAGELLATYPPPLAGVHRRFFAGGRITLDLVWADAQATLEELGSLQTPLVDAWYLDGFAPSRNSAMWGDSLYSLMAGASRPHATVASYSVAGTVRRGLQTAGFETRKHQGFANKRECLRGQFSRRGDIPAASPALIPWDLPSEPAPQARNAVVIGAGLAGAHAAAALARRGFDVRVFDAQQRAGRASGNPQGVLFTRLSHERSILGDFSLTAFLFARDLYRQMFARGELRRGTDGDLDGCVQIDPPRGDPAALEVALRGLETLAAGVSAAETDALLGVASGARGLWLPESGWLSPPAVCEALLSSPRISLRENCGDLAFAQSDSGCWEVRNQCGDILAATPILLVAAGADCRGLLGAESLPLKVARGQTTQIPAPQAMPLQRSLCHRGYIAPQRLGEHCVGATFAPNEENRDLRIADHRSNIEALATALPEWRPYLESLDPQTLAGRAELRCVSTDYLPLAGPVPKREAFLSRFGALQWDAKSPIAEHGSYRQGLYMSTAHGSRGLSYAALSAELIASQICAQPIPLPRELQRAVAPARFLIRDLVRGHYKAQGDAA